MSKHYLHQFLELFVKLLYSVGIVPPHLFIPIVLLRFTNLALEPTFLCSFCVVVYFVMDACLLLLFV